MYPVHLHTASNMNSVSWDRLAPEEKRRQIQALVDSPFWHTLRPSQQHNWLSQMNELPH